LPAFSFLRDWAHSVTELRKLIVAVVFDVMTDSYRGELQSQKAAKKKRQDPMKAQSRSGKTEGWLGRLKRIKSR
jgi:hypothetical protein